ncbi:MAG: alpha/beta fold hydrolase [Sedimentisphaerales bacterium]
MKYFGINTMSKTAVFFLILFPFGGLTARADDVNSAACKAQVLKTKIERKKAVKIYDVRIEKDVKYLGDSSPLLMDFYRPLGVDAKRLPVILYMFGGGWLSGDRTDGGRAISVCRDIAERGYICASIDYTLSTPSKGAWPQAFYECKSAVQFLRLHADEYGIDANAIGAIGCSAGGHMAALLGAAGPETGLEPNGPYAGVSSSVQAVVALYGPYNLSTLEHTINTAPWGPPPRIVVETFIGASVQDAAELFAKASPITHINGDEPPFLLIHGSEDPAVPVQQAIDMYKKLRSAGVKSELLIVKGAGHSFNLQPEQKDLRPVVVDFFDKYLKNKKKGI